VRMGTGDILSAGDRADVLVAFYQHSYEQHRPALRPGGVLLYDSDHVHPDPEDKEITAVGVPMTSATVEAVGGSSKEKGKNIYVLGLLARMFDLNIPKLTTLIKERFGGKNEDIVRNALLAFDAGHAYPGENLHFRLDQPVVVPGARPQVTTDGNTALTLGLLAAGVRYGAGYPITPWSSIMEMLRTELPKYGGLFVQCEDEIAAISTALGFSYGGNLAVTGSSGPGLSLKAEALGWAVMAEIPLIVINVQRGGPSTGLPTNIEQSDLQHMARARTRIDMTMDSFTDATIARLLAAKAGQGVEVRVLCPVETYRKDSLLGGLVFNTLSAGHIAVRLSSDSDAGNMRSYLVDDSLLRTGSAPWIPAALMYQRNHAVYTTSTAAIAEYTSTFEEVWNRSTPPE